MINTNKLCEFLIKAKRSSYAAGNNAKSVKEKDGSTSLFFIDGDFKYHDNYFGGEPFGGREVIFYKDKSVHIMVYYGKVNNTIKNSEPIYQFLREALKLIPKEYPFRGPKEFTNDNLTYKNLYFGNIDCFSGEETIIDKNGKVIYQGKYLGGKL